MNIDTSIFFRMRFWFLVVIRSYTWNANQTLFYSGLTLGCQSNFVLFWSYAWMPVKHCSIQVLCLDANQTLFYSGLTLECQPNFVLFWFYTWMSVKIRSILVLRLNVSQTSFYLCHVPTFLDLPLATSLVAFWLCHTYLLDRTYNYNANQIGFKSNMCHWAWLAVDHQPSWDLKFFKDSKLFGLPSFISKVFLKLLSGSRSSFSWYACS